jgi:hypothetical protein
MECVIKLEAKSGRGDVETIEVGKFERRVVGLTAEEVGLTLAEGKDARLRRGSWVQRRPSRFGRRAVAVAAGRQTLNSAQAGLDVSQRSQIGVGGERRDK